jgi:2-polyprenyl-3-methyl-5-hydroxy-6-metoxy-1,4-benzoquinol methylase
MRASRARSTNGISRRTDVCISGIRDDFNREHQDNSRKYAYDFDAVLRKYMMRTLRPFMPPGKALEMGCYKGEVTEMLARHYADLTVIEASSDLVAIARDRVPSATYITATFEETTLTARYDAVFLIHTLEHLDDPAGVLRRVNGWLRDTGRLFIVVPNANAPSRQIAVQMGLISHNAAITPAEHDHGHRATYSLDTLERVTLDGGLRIVHRGGVFFKPLANYQFDKLMGGDVITDAYLEGCYQLGMHYPDLCASVYLVCEAGAARA